MVLKPFQTDALNGLCAPDQLDLLNSVDCLRSQGISHYVSLPQIIVCGDQSSGKSSVLEAISGVSFPVKSNLSTRFPTELVLRKTSQMGVTVSIVPHQARTESERLALSGFHEKLEGFEGLPNLIENAKAAMGISTHGKAFSKDLLRVEVSGPDRPHLTIVDLPGLIHSETKQQSASDVELVQDVVQSYMKAPRSVILAVVSAKNDYANQIVLKLARAADKKGIRTLGVITKPDTLIAGSESEAMYISLAKNQDVEFRLGWHVLKNMDSEKGQWTLPDRDMKEKEFFAQGIWEDMSRSLLGVENLRSRLSKVLLAQIAAELPSLIDEIGVKSSACRDRLARLGEPRATLAEQQLYLFQLSQSFQSLVKAAVDGTYNDPFFGDARSEPGYQKRIRAVIQNLNQDFADDIARRGHRREITESKDKGRIPTDVIPLSRDEYIDYVKTLMQRTKSRELPGSFNPMIVSDLFLEQSAPWDAITRSHVDKVWNAAREFLGHVAAYVADGTTSKALFREIFEPALSQLLKILSEKSAELLKPHQRSHPITYNQDFSESLQKLRNERNQNECSNIVKQAFGVSSLEETCFCSGSHDLRQLVTTLVQRTEPDMNRFACSEALNCMEAYYKVALKRFIDDIANEAIEAKLISPLGGIFTPLAVSTMSADLVTSLAGESDESRAQREQLAKQLDVLTKGSDTCKRFIGVRLLGADNDTAQSGPSSNNDPVVGADDDTTQSGPGSNNDFDEELEAMVMRPLVESSERVTEARTSASAPGILLETLDSSGKTTLILNLIPQLPKTYKLALLKNEFGDVAIDSQLASSSAIGGVQELLNGCICCNLVGQLGDALDTLRKDVSPDRIIIETSGSAFPATLAMEVNRLGKETGNYVLDGVVVVIDVENWKGYEDTSYTAKMQARYTDLIVFNKWELVPERRYEDCLDRVGDLELQVAIVRSERGRVDQSVLLGLDSAFAKELEPLSNTHHNHHDSHDHSEDHQSEVEVLSVTLSSEDIMTHGVNLDSLENFLLSAPKDEIYRIKAIIEASRPPASSGGNVEPAVIHQGQASARYILNWAFGRWTFTPMSSALPRSTASSPSSSRSGSVGETPEGIVNNPLVRMTVILARGEANKWKKRIETQAYIETENEDHKARLQVKQLML